MAGGLAAGASLLAETTQSVSYRVLPHKPNSQPFFASHPHSKLGA